MRILIVQFQVEGMTDAEVRALCDELAPAFRAVRGLERKYWLADEATSTYGGAYVFDDQASIDAYLQSEIVAGIKSNPAFKNVSIRQFGVLEGPTAITTPGVPVAAV